MEKKFCSVYELTGFNGLFHVLISIIFSLINYYFLKLDDFDEYFSNLNTEQILKSLLYCFTIFNL